MPRTPNPAPQSKKIQLHSPFLHARLPQMLPKVQYAHRSKTPLSKSGSPDSSGSAKMDPQTLSASVSHIQTNPLPASSTTLTKKTYHPHRQFHVLIPPFKHPHHSAGPNTPSHSLTMSPPTKPSWPPLLECVTMSTVATCTLSRSKRLFKSAELSDTEAHPAKMTKLRCSSQDSTKFDDWNLDLSCLPLRHQHPLTSPSRHHPYRATRKSLPVLQPPVPESTLWPADWLRPSNALPEDSRVWGLKLAVWEHEYRLFRRGFTMELNCCLLAHQEELRHRLP